MRLGAVVLGLIVAEGLTRVGLSLCARLFPPPSAAIGSETLSRLWYVYSDERYSALEETTHEATYDPHRGYRQASGLKDVRLYNSTLSTNSRGIRGVKEYVVPKPASVTRIVALGDSMTFGEGVPDDATWPAQLAAGMPGVEVANLGGRGYAHDQMYFALVDDGLALEPDVVVLGFFGPDLVRNESTFYAYEKPRLARAGNSWQMENVPVPMPRDVMHRVRSWPLIYALPRGLLEMSQPGEPDTDYDPARAREILRRIVAAASGVRARFVLVNIPENPDGEQQGRSFFNDYCTRTHAECVDALPLFQLPPGDPKKPPGPYTLPHNIHYSREGYAVVAGAVREYLALHPVAVTAPASNTSATQTSAP
jgi:hypothetical protein